MCQLMRDLRFMSLGTSPPRGRLLRSCLTESVYKVVLKKPIPAQIRQLILYIRNSKGSVDGFVQEWTCAKRPEKHFV